MADNLLYRVYKLIKSTNDLKFVQFIKADRVTDAEAKFQNSKYYLAHNKENIYVYLDSATVTAATRYRKETV
jgi:hypothetical protein